MKGFLINTIYFIFIFTLINFIMYYYIVKPALFEKYIYNAENISNYNFMIVSDSHGAYLENSPNFHGIFNASFVSDNYHDMLLKIKYFTKKMPEKRTVFLSIDNHQFSEYRDGDGNINKTISYVMDYNSLDPSYVTSGFYIKKWTKFLPFLNTDQNTIISDYIISNLGSNNTEITVPSIKHISKAQLEKEAYDRVKYQFENDNLSKDQLKYFLNIIDFCKKNKIRLVAVKFPVTKPYWNYVDNYNYGIEEILNIKEVELIDLHDLFFDKNEYFRDQDHMNVIGGSLFTERLIEEINKR